MQQAVVAAVHPSARSPAAQGSPWRRKSGQITAASKRISARLALANDAGAVPAEGVAVPNEGVAVPTEGVAWDPDGLLPPPSTEGHFARRARERAAAAGASLQQTGGLRPIPAEHLAAGGLPATDGSLYDRPAFEAQLTERYMPVDLDTPGLKILHFDPPVFALPAFFSEEECDDAVAAAVEGNTLVPSKVGGGNLRDELYSADSQRRTSSSVLLDAGVQAAQPRLRSMAAALQARCLQLLGQGDGAAWGAPGKLPAPGQYCYESLQMARYERGQHFLAHEDGFPAGLARQNGFQRHATLLVYLNSVPQGGATRFDMLNLAVRPEKGKALLFFPAFADGTADPRSLHTAEDAVDTKWVTQQWVARGLAGAAVDPIAAALSGGLPLGGAAAAQQAQRVQKPAALRREAAEDGPSAAELALRAAKRGKAKKAGGKGKQGGGGKGFGG